MAIKIHKLTYWYSYNALFICHIILCYCWHQDKTALFWNRNILFCQMSRLFITTKQMHRYHKRGKQLYYVQVLKLCSFAIFALSHFSNNWHSISVLSFIIDCTFFFVQHTTMLDTHHNFDEVWPIWWTLLKIFNSNIYNINYQCAFTFDTF